MSGVEFSAYGSGFERAFWFLPIIVIIGFIFVFGYIIFIAIKGSIELSKNNNSPILTVKAKIVAKRTEVIRHSSGHNSSLHTTYFTTFEVESGDRIELRVKDTEYGLLVENDIGQLTFQGKRYKSFERNK